MRVGEAVNAARVLINEPGNRLTPREFVERGAGAAAVPGVTTEILDEQPHRGARHGAAARRRARQRRAAAPAGCALRAAGRAGAPVLGLVGKGITFDTGGISIKPADGMERMKDDMAGGAAVVAALRAIALEQLPLRVIAVVPATENMPGGTRDQARRRASRARRGSRSRSTTPTPKAG